MLFTIASALVFDVLIERVLCCCGLICCVSCLRVVLIDVLFAIVLRVLVIIFCV